jgi:hypothetical protein
VAISQPYQKGAAQIQRLRHGTQRFGVVHGGHSCEMLVPPIAGTKPTSRPAVVALNAAVARSFLLVSHSMCRHQLLNNTFHHGIGAASPPRAPARPGDVARPPHGHPGVRRRACAAESIKGLRAQCYRPGRHALPVPPRRADCTVRTNLNRR